MQKRSKILLQIFVLFFLSFQIEAVNIKLLKGTVLSDMDPAYAPFWGLVMWEEKIAEQFYRLSAKQMLKKAEEALVDAKPEQVLEKAEILKTLKEQKNTATEDLVAQMFNEAGGTFNVTNAPGNPARQLKPEHLGTILRMIFEYQTLQNYVPVKNGVKPITKEEQLTKNLKDYLVGLNFTRPVTPGSAEMKVFPSGEWVPFVKALVGAVQECAITNSDQIYPENTAQEIVLGYMLAKSNTRQDLENYLSAFTGKSVVLSDDGYSAQDFAKILSSAPDLTKGGQFANFVCATVYQQKYASPLPKIVPNSSVNYQKQEFSDCVETTIRNLCNIATYNEAKQTVGEDPQDVVMSKELQDFYNQKELHKNPAEVGNNDVHQAWTDLVENKVGMLYGRLLVTGTSDGMIAKYQCDGVIPVDKIDPAQPLKTITISGKNYQVQEKKVGSKIYWLVPPESGLTCYELTTSILNIIVALNNLFDLKLYSSVSDILQPDFAQKYFETMCEKLGWHASEYQIQKVIDLAQGKSEHVEVELSIGGSKFKLNLTTKAHSFVSVDPARNSSTLISQKSLMQADGKTQAACVALEAVDDWDLKYLNSTCLQYQSVLNPDKRLKVIKFLINDSKLLSTLEPYVVKLIMSMSEFSDPHYQDEILDNFAKLTTISKPIAQALVMMTTMAHLKYGYSEVAVTYSKVLLNDTAQSKYIDELLILMNSLPFRHSFFDYIDSLLINKLLTFENVNSLWSLIAEGMKDYDHFGRSNALKVIKRLFTEKLITSENVNFLWSLIDKCMKDYHAAVRSNALKIINNLITEKLITSDNVNSLLSLIDQWIHNNDFFVRLDAVKVINNLITQKLITSENVNSLVNSLLSLIDKEMQNENYIVRENALDLLKELITAQLITSETIDKVYPLLIQVELHAGKAIKEKLQKQLKQLDLVKNDENSDAELHMIKKSEVPSLTVEEPTKSNENQQLILERERQLVLERQMALQREHQEHVDPNRGEPGEGAEIIR